MKRYKRKRGMQLASSFVQLSNTRILLNIKSTLGQLEARNTVVIKAIRTAIKSKESTTPEEFKDLLLEYNSLYYKELNEVEG
jgi:hypothetical protein